MAGIADKKYTFKLLPTPPRLRLLRQSKKLFGVKVAKVNTISVRGGTAARHACWFTLPLQKGHRYPTRLQEIEFFNSMV